MYYIEESQEPIIPPDEFDAVQTEIERRKELGGSVRCISPFSSKIICGDCGAFFGKKTWSSNNERYRKSIWRCNARYNVKGQRNCQTPHITEDEIKCRFLEAFNELMQDKKNIIEDCETAQKLLCNITELDEQISELESELHLVEGIAMQAINENKRHAINQSDWIERNEKYLKRHEEITVLLEQLDEEKAEKVSKSKVIAQFIKSVSKQGVVSEFNNDLWFAVIETVVMSVDGSLTFKFKNGIEIKN